MKSKKNYMQKYSEAVSKHSGIVLAIVLVLFVVCLIYMQNIEIKDIEMEDMLPEKLDVIKSMNILTDVYGGVDFANIVLEVNPDIKNSNEPRDIRSYEVLKYQENIQKILEKYSDIADSSSSTDIIKSLNNGVIPKDKHDIIRLTKDNPSFDNYINKDRTISIIKVQLSEDYDKKMIVDELEEVVSSLPKVSGISVSLGGSTLTAPIVEELVSSDMVKTSSYSIIGIVIILLLIFSSIRYGLTPLITIVVGVIWAMGLAGFIGMNLNTATSAVISMIMGIGIDFGIQVTNRFRQEKENKSVEKAMEATLNAVLSPMIITTVAALIGFFAMGLGTIAILDEMGKIMSLGVAMCFLAAITAVPSITIISEKLSQKFKKKNRRKLK